MRQAIDKSHDAAQAQTTPHPDIGLAEQADAPPSQIDHAGPMQQTMDGTDPSQANRMIRWMTLLAVIAVVAVLAVITAGPVAVVVAIPVVAVVLVFGGILMALSRSRDPHGGRRTGGTV